MGRAVDLFVTYRFLKLLTTPFEKTDAFKLGIIDANGHRIKLPKSSKPAVELTTSELKNSYTILHKLIFNIKKLFAKVPGLRTKVGTYAAALFLLKDTFKEHVEDPDKFEKEFIKYLKERLLLNHFIVLNNVFGADACATLLLFKIQKEYWPALKSFLLYLNILKEDELKDVQEDDKVKEVLEKL